MEATWYQVVSCIILEYEAFIYILKVNKWVIEHNISEFGSLKL